MLYGPGIVERQSSPARRMLASRRALEMAMVSRVTPNLKVGRVKSKTAQAAGWRAGEGETEGEEDKGRGEVANGGLGAATNGSREYSLPGRGGRALRRVRHGWPCLDMDRFWWDSAMRIVEWM